MIDTKAQEIRAGRQAEDLLKNEAFQRAITALRKEYHDAWESTPLHEQDRLLAIRQAIGNLNRVISHLESMLASGAITKKQIDELEERRKRNLFQRIVA